MMPSSGGMSPLVNETSVAASLTDCTSAAGPVRPKTSLYRVVVMGSARVGKTALINQFLYDAFRADYKPTIEELHRGEYDVAGTSLVLDILDTSGAYQFPAMRALSISKADGFVLVYAVDDKDSFEEVCQLRQQILQSRIHKNNVELVPGTMMSSSAAEPSVPIVVVANKNDLDIRKRQVQHETAETTVCIDWEHVYIETSAKENRNVVNVFKSLLSKANIPFSPTAQRRRFSLPPSFLATSPSKKLLLKRNSCHVS